MKYMVGLQFTNDEFIDCIIENKEYISEVYFSWSDFPNGRSNQLISEQYNRWELQDRQISVLKRLFNEGVKFNLLFNANCYGRESQARTLFEKVGETIEYIRRRFHLQSVTTTSPLIAKFIHANFEDIEVRASVNMEIGSIEGMDYLRDYFDGFYMKRELNRNFEEIERLHAWAEKNGKKLYMLANSGCLNNCSAHNFHDNLVAHESEIAQMNNAYEFGGICREFLKDESNYDKLVERTNFVRPEDMHKYEQYFEAAKLATRVHRTPCSVIRSYVEGKFSGNILNILEPAHNIYPYVIENGETLRLKRLDTGMDMF